MKSRISRMKRPKFCLNLPFIYLPVRDGPGGGCPGSEGGVGGPQGPDHHCRERAAQGRPVHRGCRHQIGQPPAQRGPRWKGKKKTNNILFVCVIAVPPLLSIIRILAHCPKS